MLLAPELNGTEYHHVVDPVMTATDKLDGWEKGSSTSVISLLDQACIYYP